MKIFFIGLPGSGKTTIGKLLAEALEVRFVDLDEEIEKAERSTVSEIFERKKEDYFRSVEAEQLAKWCQVNEDFVMATGGGAPCFHTNMKIINESGVSIFLDVSARSIANRMLKAEMAKRPLLAQAHADEVKDRIEFLRSHRVNFYKQAAIILKEDQITAENIVRELKSLERKS